MKKINFLIKLAKEGRLQAVEPSEEIKKLIYKDQRNLYLPPKLCSK